MQALDRDLHVAELERALQLLLDALGEVDGVALALHVLDQDRELVAAQARDEVGRAQHRLQPARQVHQQLVAGLVAEAVVDQLEAVEVEEHHREALLRMALHARDRAHQLLVEVGAVRQLREAVVVGDVVAARPRRGGAR